MNGQVFRGAAMTGIFTIDAIKKIRFCKPLLRIAAVVVIYQRLSLFKKL